MLAVPVNEDTKLLALDVIKWFVCDHGDEGGLDLCCRDQTLITSPELLSGWCSSTYKSHPLHISPSAVNIIFPFDDPLSRQGSAN